MAGAGVQDRVSFVGESERGAEGLARVGDLVDLAVGNGGAGALDECRADRGRVFEPRVEVGDDDDVGTSGRDRAHLGAFGGVAVAVGAEDHDHPSRGEPADRGERLQERVGAVAVVDVDDGPAVARDALGAAGDVGVDAAVALEHLGDVLELVAGVDEHDDREGRVGGHVPAEQRNARLETTAVGGPRARTRCTSAPRRAR